MAQAITAEAEHCESYTYTPLEHHDSIRLINLEPAASRDAELVCTITSCRLGSAHQFEAISYVWGEPIFSETLRAPEGIVKITSSLATALKHFRLESETRYLWADAVCINQTNNDEKGHQVGQMGLIYKTATRVLAWLGEGTEITHQAMLDCERLYFVAERYHVEDKEIDYDVFSGPTLKIIDQSGKEAGLVTWDVVAAGDKSDSIKSILKDIRSSKLNHLVEMPWFSRLWVIQEVANSSSTSLHCGSYSIEWKIFASVMRLLVAIVNMQGPSALVGIERNDEIMTPDLKRAWNLVHLRTEYRATSIGKLFCISVYRQFGGNVHKAASHHCSDDRDRIFGLLSLASELAIDHGINLKPDYNKPAPEIYRDFALQYLISTASEYPRDARILSDAGLWQRSAESWDRLAQLNYANPEYLPSWVPEYRPRNMSLDELPWMDAPFNTRWHTCFPRIHKITVFEQHSFTDHSNLLIVSATGVDRIESLLIVQDKATAQKAQASEMPTAWLTSLEETSHWETLFDSIGIARMISKHLMQDDKYFTGEDGRAALVRTLLAECSHPHLSTIFWNYPNHKDEAQMVALWDMFERCCLHPEGELRQIFQQSQDSPEQHQVYWQRKLQEEKQDGRSMFSSDCKDSLDFMMAVQWVLSRCKLIFSTRGLLALVPKAAQQYDMIVQLDGTKMPYVVRKLGDSGLSCLVGPCYVHGIMHCPSFEHDLEISHRGGVICLV